jgi:uncharacterized protein DUF1508
MIATSEAYETKAAALRGIESVRSNAPKARLDDTTEKNGSSKPSKVTRALKRDWEQTKADLPGLRGKNLNQDVDDTLAQAAGERKVPAKDKPNRG